MPLLSIVIPAYNEEASIGGLLNILLALDLAPAGFSKQIIVVDDGSRDSTGEIVKSYPVTLIQQRNQGKGSAVQTGIRAATGEYVIVQDADLEYDPTDYLRMLTELQQAGGGCIYGSRTLGQYLSRGVTLTPGRHPEQKLGPWLAGVLLSFWTWLLYGLRLTDTLTAYKIYPRSVFSWMKIETHGFETDHEITAKLAMRGIPIREVPIAYKPRSVEEGKKIRAVDGLIALWVLLKFRFVAAKPAQTACVLVGLLLLVLGVQRAAKAAEAGFGAYPDEASHFVSAVMIHDYLKSPLAARPTAHAVNYYVYRPYLAIGYWPPMFYATSAIWMFAFGVGRAQILLFVALGVVLLAGSIFLAGRRYWGALPAAAVSILFCLVPIVQWSSCVVMTDIPVALFAFWATLSLGSYFDRPSIRAALAFGLCASFALLTKYSAGAIICLPVVAVILFRRWDLVKRAGFWLQPLIVVALVMPWVVLTRSFMTRGFATYVRDSFLERLQTFGTLTLNDLGAPLMMLLLAGWLTCIVNAKRLKQGEQILLLQPVVSILFVLLGPAAIELRYFLPALPCVLVSLLIAGRIVLPDFTLPRIRVAAPALLAILVALYGGWAWLRFSPLPGPQMKEVARWLDQQRFLDGGSILVPTNFEGPLIAEFAALDIPASRHVLVRPRKLISRTDWLGIKEESRFSPAQLAEFLRDSPLNAVVLSENRSAERPHDRMLRRVLQEEGSQWRRVGALPAPHGETLSIFLRDPLAKQSTAETFEYFQQALLRDVLSVPGARR